MTKAQGLKLLNPVLFVLVVLQFASILLGKVGVEIPGAYQFHTWNGFLIGVLILVHVWLNWAWIRSNILKSKKTPRAKAAGTTPTASQR